MTAAPSEGGSPPVAVIGGGLSGIACARRLHDAGVPVVVHERSHRLGGRMAVRTEALPSGPHPVDIGAPYFTVRDDGFTEVVQSWTSKGLARPWTDSIVLATPNGQVGASTGPLRWSSSYGMRSLVEDLADGLDVRLRHEVTGISAGPGDTLTVDGEVAATVVLAMPDPQADRLLDRETAAMLRVTSRPWVPALCVWAAWDERWWTEFNAAFVDGSSVLSWVSDDGRSRGDGAPVLVAHTHGDYAEQHLDDAEAAIEAVLRELPRVLGTGQLPAPLWTRVHRWSLASSRHPHSAQFALRPSRAGGKALIGVCGDGWGERSRIEQAWMSGHSLAGRLLATLYPGA